MTHKPTEPIPTPSSPIASDPTVPVMELTAATSSVPTSIRQHLQQHQVARPSSAFRAWSSSVQVTPTSPQSTAATASAPALSTLSRKATSRGVVAATHIPAGASCEFDLSSLSFCFEASSSKGGQRATEILCTPNGKLEPVESSQQLSPSAIPVSNDSRRPFFDDQSSPWTKDLVLAKDCHSRNLIISIASSAEEGRSNLQTSRVSGQICTDLPPGTPIVAWFSEELCSTMGMPFLGLNHIKGRGSYSCDRCEAIFKDPNPLKIHLLLNCGKTSPKEFWARLFCNEPSTVLPSFKTEKSNNRNRAGSPSSRQQSPPITNHHLQESLIDLSASRKSTLFRENIPRSSTASSLSSSHMKNGQGAPRALTDYYHPLKATSVTKSAEYKPAYSATSSSLLADVLASRGVMSSPVQRLHTTMANPQSMTAAAAASLMAAQLTSSGFGPFVNPSHTAAATVTPVVSPSAQASAGSSRSQDLRLNRMSPSVSAVVPAAAGIGDIAGGQFCGFPGLLPGLPFAQTALLGLRFPGFYAHQAAAAAAMFQHQHQQALNLQVAPSVISPAGPPHQAVPSTSSPTSSITPPAAASAAMTNAELEAMVSNIGRSKGGHLCIYCGKVYSRKYGLKIHIRTHTGYKPLRCKVCLRPFGDPSNLNKHIRLHAQGDTPYRCDLCGKILVRRRDLERHLLSRHPEHQVTTEPASGNGPASPDRTNNGSSPHAEPDTSCASTSSHQPGQGGGSPRESDYERESMPGSSGERKKRRLSDQATPMNMSPSSTDDFAPTSSTMMTAGAAHQSLSKS